MENVNVKRLCEEGNTFLDQLNWSAARTKYTEYIETATTLLETTGDSNYRNNLRTLYSLRAETWLQEDKFEQAVEDSNNAHRINFYDDTFMVLYRKGRALMGLKKHDEACDCLEEAVVRCPQRNSELLATLRDARNLRARNRQGKYDISDYLLQPSAPIPQVGDFVGHVTIRRTSDGRGGLGLFATTYIIPGQLLLVSNAVAVTEDDAGQRANPADLNVTDREDEFQDHRLVKDVITAAPSKSQALLRLLYSLDDDSPSCLAAPALELFNLTDKEMRRDELEDENLELDRSRIQVIIRRNSFEGLQQTYSSKSRIFPRTQNLISGLWLLPSFINHSCLPNSSRLEVGRAMFIHASKTINQGEEITISYFDTLVPYKQRQDKCARWDFQCKCSRCIVEHSLEEALRPLTDDFEQVRNRALQETIAVQRSRFPMESSARTDFAELFVEAERIIMGSPQLGLEDQKNWIRASFVSTYLALRQCDDALPTMFDNRIPPADTVMRAIKCTVPGDIRNLVLCAQTFKASKRYASWFNNTRDLYILRLFIHQRFVESTEACVSAFGNHREEVLVALIFQYSKCCVF